MMPTSACFRKTLQELGKLWMSMTHNYPGKKKTPKQFDSGNADAEFQQQLKITIDSNIIEVLDVIVTSIKDRFEQPGYLAYKNLEELLLIAVKKEDYEEASPLYRPPIRMTSTKHNAFRYVYILYIYLYSLYM